MSKAFTKEESGSGNDPLPDREISPHRNLVTADGLAAIEATLSGLERALMAARTSQDTEAVAAVARDIRYWTARRASAEVMPPPEKSGRVQFGSTVTILRDDGRTQVWRIVGEDEADPKQGTVSYAAPLAQALFGREEGDDVVLHGRRAEISRVE